MRSWVVRALFVVALGGCASESPRPNVVLVVADTLRADYLGSYGFPGDVSPQLDRLASEAVLFERCVSQAPWTKPATASLLTSLYPGTHGLTDHEGGFWSSSEERRTGRLPAEALTLAEVLHLHGYRTAAFTANSWLVREYGFAQGFDHYDDYAARLDTHADELLENARRWLDHSASGVPFFLYLHVMDVHAPYDAPRADYDAVLDSVPGRGARALTDAERPDRRWNNIEVPADWANEERRHRVDYWRARYAAGVRALDRRLGRLRALLEERGALANTLWIVTSDHGEHLFEHGDWSHGQNLYQHQLHVPLWIRPVGATRSSGLRVTEIVELVDVMPTVLALVGATSPTPLQGRDLSPLFAAPAEELSTRAVRERYGFSTAVQHQRGLHAVTTERYKLIVDREAGTRRLFDLTEDPAESTDLASVLPEVAEELEGALVRHLADQEAFGSLASEAATIPEELARRLRDLGYL